MGNYVDFFRCHDKYDDVFIEGDHYLYAETEPVGWADVLVCYEYQITADGFLRGETISHDVAYLQRLEYAPLAIAERITEHEFEIALAYDVFNELAYATV